MKISDLIKKRRTIRRFKQGPVSRRILDDLVDCGRLAPSSANLQPLEYIVVDEAGMVAKVFPTLRWAGYIAPRGIPPEGKKPVAYIVVLVNTGKSEYGAEHDAGAAIENMILAALGEGIASCWIGSIERKLLRQILGIPEGLKIDSVLALGYPDEKSVVEEMKDSIKYWKDKDGVLHVPKRALKDITRYNSY